MDLIRVCLAHYLQWRLARVFRRGLILALALAVSLACSNDGDRPRGPVALTGSDLTLASHDEPATPAPSAPAPAPAPARVAQAAPGPPPPPAIPAPCPPGTVRIGITEPGGCIPISPIPPPDPPTDGGNPYPDANGQCPPRYAVNPVTAPWCVRVR